MRGRQNVSARRSKRWCKKSGKKENDNIGTELGVNGEDEM